MISLTNFCKHNILEGCALCDRERIAALEASLTAERERADRLAAALEKLQDGVYRVADRTGSRDYDRDVFPEMMIADAALAAHKQARETR